MICDRQAIGRTAERDAERLLIQRGLRCIGRNYRCKGGEIDLLMLDRDCLVFVEVRYRSHPGYGGALNSIDSRKRKRLVHAARHYLAHHPWQGPCRFDVIALGPDADPDWVRSAFDA